MVKIDISKKNTDVIGQRTFQSIRIQQNLKRHNFYTVTRWLSSDLSLRN